MNFIDELYYGHINPNEVRFNQTLEYTKAVRVFTDNEKQLMESLSGSELELFNDMLKAGDEIIDFTNTENFKLGFKLGVKMMCDCFDFDTDRIFKDIK